MKLIAWDRDTAERELNKRLGFARDARQKLESTWVASERAVFTIPGLDDGESATLVGNNTLVGEGQAGPSLAINTIFRNYRFSHSQLSANPPMVIARPTSSDLEDRRRADAADRLIRYAMRTYKFPEWFDILSGHTLLYGTGALKMIHNPEKGEFISFDRGTGEVLMTGDFELSAPLPWKLFVDADAETADEVRFVFERIDLPFDEALSRWPEHKDLLDGLRTGNKDFGRTETADSPVNPVKYDCIELYQYWEKGLPSNGMLGRFGWCTRDGKLLGDIDISPARISIEKDEKGNLVTEPEEGKDILEVAYLPYILFTDVDNVGSVWGKSTVAFQIPLQEVHNALLNVTVDTARAHGVARMIMPDTMELAEDSITNSSFDVVRTTGTGKMEFMAPLAMPGIMGDLLALMQQGINDMAGMNESMLGQQSRETSGFSMQYATQQGNLLRHRLFKKYTMAVESAYKMFINLVIRHWKTEQTVRVLGKEKAFEAVDLKGSDVNGGFDLIVEYGASLSLDPVSRRQELLTMMPLFKEGGVSPKRLLRMTKLNELENVYDSTELAAQRQQEYFEEIIASGQSVKPREMQDHKGMLEYAYEYVMTAEFRDQEESIKLLIEEHIRAREALAAAGPQPGALGVPGGEVPQAPGMPGGLPPQAGQTGAQADVSGLAGIAPKG